MATRTRKPPELPNGVVGGVVGNDATQHALDTLNERLYRVETEVGRIKKFAEPLDKSTSIFHKAVASPACRAR